MDSGRFDQNANAAKSTGLTTPDKAYHGLTYTKAFGKMAYVTKLVAQLMRDLGSTPSPQNSFPLNLGLETLHLRVRQHCANVQEVAEFLQGDPHVACVRYCGLKDDESYEPGRKCLPDGSCGVMAFGLKGDRDTAIKFMDSLELVNIATHVAGARSCVLHQANHTHRQLSDEQLKEAGIAPDQIRLSVGTEDADDIIDDLSKPSESSDRPGQTQTMPANVPTATLSRIKDRYAGRIRRHVILAPTHIHFITPAHFYSHPTHPQT